MIQQLPPRSLLEDLETRHDEVLEQLGQLNERVEAALRDVTGAREPALVGAAPMAAGPVTALEKN